MLDLWLAHVGVFVGVDGHVGDVGRKGCGESVKKEGERVVSVARSRIWSNAGTLRRPVNDHGEQGRSR